MVFVLALGLLVGLLVPWKNLFRPKWTYGPVITNVTSTSLSLQLAANRPETRVVYAVVPSYWLAEKRCAGRTHAWHVLHAHMSHGRIQTVVDRCPGPCTGCPEARRPDTCPCLRLSPPHCLRRSSSRRLLEALIKLDPTNIDYSELWTLVSLKEGAKLEPFAVACGEAMVVAEKRNYTMTIASLPGLFGTTNATLNQECATSFSIGRNTAVPFPDGAKHMRGRCLRCPVLVPGIGYDLLIAAASGRKTKVKRMTFVLPSAAVAA